VLPDETGLLVDEPAPEAFADAIATALDRPFDVAAIRRQAERFSRERFGNEMEAIVGEGRRW
jgi:glycosyltransferase involved in cell wall biosynthesis